MIIPHEILLAFEKEVEGLKFGKVTLGLIIRNEHIHYEIDKHYTLLNIKDKDKNPHSTL